MKMLRNSFVDLLAISLITVSSANAADATWNGTTNGTWSTGTNWSAVTPGTGNTATFSGAGNGNTTISLSGITIGNIVFSSASVAAYTLGSGAVGSQSLALNDSGAITVNSTVGTSQLINANVVLGTGSTSASYTLTNNSGTNGNLLTIAGNVSSGLSNTNNTNKTLTLGGSATGLISGVISGDGSGNGGSKSAIVGLTKAGIGSWTLANANTYSGVTTVTAGTLFANNASGSATGTGAISVASGAIFGGSGTSTPGGTNGFNVTGALAPGGSVGATGNLTINLGSTTGTVVMNNTASFQYDLGVAGADINSFGTSDLLTLAGTAAADILTFNGNSINFGGTGAIGYYKLFDSARNNTNTWAGLTVGGTGLITGGLTVSNLTSGLSGELIMGGSLLGGTTGDIYLHVVPEPSAALLAGIGALCLLRRRRVA